MTKYCLSVVIFSGICWPGIPVRRTGTIGSYFAWVRFPEPCLSSRKEFKEHKILSRETNTESGMSIKIVFLLQTSCLNSVEPHLVHDFFWGWGWGVEVGQPSFLWTESQSSHGSDRTKEMSTLPDPLFSCRFLEKLVK